MATKKTPDVIAAPELAHYLVGATPILQDGQRFEPGSVITLRPAQAARLGLHPAPATTTQPLE